MTQTVNQQWRVNAGGAVVYADQIYGANGQLVQPSDLAAITRLVVDQYTGAQTSADVDVASSVFLELQTSAEFPSPYNFRDVVPGDEIPRRRRYGLQYLFTPVDGEPFRSIEIDLIGD